VFTSKNGSTFLNIGATYPNQSFTGWIPNSSPRQRLCCARRDRSQPRQDHGRIEMYKGKPEIRINAAEQLEVE
jgi:hypothetical protein